MEQECQWCDVLINTPLAVYVVEYTTAAGNREAWHLCESCLAQVQDMYACDETAHMTTWTLMARSAS